MADYHTVYKDVEGTSTEWEDLQVKYGNWEKREKPEIAPWVPAEEVDKSSKDSLDKRTEDELEDLEDDFADDRFLEEYRKKRIAELKVEASVPRFGSVELIKGADFVREVSQAPPDLWVVVHLFRDSVPECKLLQACLDELAEKYSSTKFVKIISTECIKDYPDFNLPTVLVYFGGQVKATLVGLQRLGGMQCSPEDVAFALCKVGSVLSGPEGSREAMVEQLGKDYVKRLLSKHEVGSDDDDDDN